MTDRMIRVTEASALPVTAVGLEDVREVDGVILPSREGKRLRGI
jgi:hypothetical protein